MSADLEGALGRIVGKLRAAGVPHMIVGSVAALVHGRARATVAVDLVIAASPSQLLRFVDSLPDTDFYISAEAAKDALARRSLFNVIDFASGMKVDLIVRKQRAFSEAEFERRQTLELFGEEHQVATIEDTIVSKLEWAQIGGGSARQLEDVTELVRLAGLRLDRAYVEHWVVELKLEQGWRQVSSSP